MISNENFYKQFIDLPSSADLGYKQEVDNLPFNSGFWYSDSRGHDEPLNTLQGQVPTSRDGNNAVQTLMRRYVLYLLTGNSLCVFYVA